MVFDKSSFIQTLTVGIGVTPILQPEPLADFTADREFHPALKTFISLFTFIISPQAFLSKVFCGLPIQEFFDIIYALL